MSQLLDHSKWSWIGKLGVFLSSSAILIVIIIVLLEMAPEKLRVRLTSGHAYVIWMAERSQYHGVRVPLEREYENARFILGEHAKSREEKWFTGTDGIVYHVDFARSEIMWTARRLQEYDEENSRPPRLVAEFVMRYYWRKVVN